MRAKLLRSAWWLVLLGMLAADTGCGRKAANAFPETGTVAGWTKTGETRTFDAANLWQYIDGDAEHYVKAGVVTTSTADYRYRSGLEAVVDVHTMSNAAGARTIFEADPQAGSRTAQLGDAARVYGQSVIFRKGPYLVRIVAYESAPNEAEALQALAKGVEARL
jgi:predicted small lipoprotein YifL